MPYRASVLEISSECNEQSLLQRKYLGMSEEAIAAHPELEYIQYHSDKESVYLPAIRQLISRDLSEPYSIYVYRYFLYQWGDLCFMVCDSLSADR